MILSIQAFNLFFQFPNIMKNPIERNHHVQEKMRLRTKFYCNKIKSKIKQNVSKKDT